MYCTENLTERLAIGFADFMKMENIIPVFTPVEVKEENEPVLFIIRETANRLHGTLFYYLFFFFYVLPAGPQCFRTTKTRRVRELRGRCSRTKETNDNYTFTKHGCLRV